VEKYRDFFVGLFILASAGIILGLLIVTSGALEKTQDFYLRTETATGLNQDTRVVMQGLQVGRISQVNPLVEATDLSFVAVLELREAYPDGTPLLIPRGTQGVIEEPSPIAAAIVRLDVPPRDLRRGFLASGDTLESERRPGAMDVLAELAAELRDEVIEILSATELLLQESTRTVAESRTVITSTNQLVSRTTPRLEAALETLRSGLERSEAVLAEVEPRVGPLQDSLAVTLAEAAQLVRDMDSLIHTTHSVVMGQTSTIDEALQHLRRTTEILEHFADQVSRRPTRFMTGVTPPPLDTTERRP